MDLSFQGNRTAAFSIMLMKRGPLIISEWLNLRQLFELHEKANRTHTGTYVFLFTYVTSNKCPKLLLILLHLVPDVRP